MPNYFYRQHGKQYGPIAGRELQILARKGQLELDAEVWLEGTAERLLAKNVKNLFRSQRKTGPIAADARANRELTKPSAVVPPSPSPSQAKQWHVQMADGQRHGPVTKAQLDLWVAERRVDAECQVWQVDWREWKLAGDIYPTLANRAAPGAGVPPVPTAPPPPTPAVIAGDGSVVKATIDASRSVSVDASRTVTADGEVSAPTPPTPAVTVGDGSVVKATIDASQSVSVAGDMVSRKELHSHQTTNVYKESSFRAIGDTIGGRRHAPQTAQQCIEELAREIHSGMGVMPFVVLFLFWPAGLYMIVTAGKRKAAKVNGLFTCLRSFQSRGEVRKRDYDELQAEWSSVRRSEQTRATIMTCVVACIFVGYFLMLFVSLFVLMG